MRERAITGNMVTGIVLAGGLSRRMGGGDKTLIDVAGRPMLSYVIERLAPQTGAVVINANGDAERFASFELPVVADTVGEFPGPLAGVLAGLRWAQIHTPAASHVVSVSGDAPLFPTNLVAEFRKAIGETPGAIAMARSDGHVHPVIGLWPVTLADDLETALREGTRKVLVWTDRHDVRVVDFPPGHLGGVAFDPFFNANRPEDLERLEALLGGGPQ